MRTVVFIYEGGCHGDDDRPHGEDDRLRGRKELFRAISINLFFFDPVRARVFKYSILRKLRFVIFLALFLFG
ncbi:hypothetical protein [Parabacteroides johnsonii]|uniref:hypothetical protein n=1 Tax=Parabacteroides johnsonii TaxID=387661 RepID=UPI00307F964A